MGQLLIIDVQQSFISSQDLDKSILKLSKKYAEVFHCYDLINGEGVWPYDMWEHMARAFEEGEFDPKLITKEYAFLIESVEAYENEEFLIELGKLMLQHKIFDARHIQDNDAYEEFSDLYDSFGIDPDFESYAFILPKELIESLRENIRDGVTVVGGGVNQCLKEIRILLSILDIKYTVLPEYTY